LHLFPSTHRDIAVTLSAPRTGSAHRAYRS
jgi:hypothetical protein